MSRMSTKCPVQCQSEETEEERGNPRSKSPKSSTFITSSNSPSSSSSASDWTTHGKWLWRVWSLLGSPVKESRFCSATGLTDWRFFFASQSSSSGDRRERCKQQIGSSSPPEFHNSHRFITERVPRPSTIRWPVMDCLSVCLSLRVCLAVESRTPFRQRHQGFIRLFVHRWSVGGGGGGVGGKHNKQSRNSASLRSHLNSQLHPRGHLVQRTPQSQLSVIETEQLSTGAYGEAFEFQSQNSHGRLFKFKKTSRRRSCI